MLRAGTLAGQLVSLLQFQTETADALAVRVTLKPIERADGLPIFGSTVGPASPQVVTAPYIPGYRGGWSGNDVSMPVPHPLFGGPFYGAIEWGVGEAPRSRLLCDWPAAGGSIELVATNVNVYGALGYAPDGSDPSGIPAFSVDAGPSEGMGYNDEPLCLTQPPTQSIANVPSYAVPEFARSVIIAVDETIAPGEFIGITFTGPFSGSNAWTTRLDFADRKPVELQIPGGALMMRASGSGATAQGAALYLQWRIAP